MAIIDNPNMYFTIVKTKFGYVCLSRSNVGLVFVTLPQPSRELVQSKINSVFDDIVEDASAFTDLALQIQRYFNGEKVVFLEKLDYRDATSFNRAVWETTYSIPYGEVRSYCWIARQIGYPKAARAVGNALSRNRLPIVIPCHRVINENGGIGGFSGGLKMKKRLLQLEGLELYI